MATHTAHLRGNVNQLVDGYGSVMALPQVAEQAAADHQLRDDVDRFLLRADGVQRHEARVTQLLHHVSLFQELFRRHRAGLHRLDGHVDRALPLAWNAYGKWSMENGKRYDGVCRIGLPMRAILCKPCSNSKKSSTRAITQLLRARS